jgi:hypothetical protein
LEQRRRALFTALTVLDFRYAAGPDLAPATVERVSDGNTVVSQDGRLLGRLSLLTVAARLVGASLLFTSGQNLARRRSGTRCSAIPRREQCGARRPRARSAALTVAPPTHRHAVHQRATAREATIRRARPMGTHLKRCPARSDSGELPCGTSASEESTFGVGASSRLRVGRLAAGPSDRAPPAVGFRTAIGPLGELERIQVCPRWRVVAGGVPALVALARQLFGSSGASRSGDPR